MPGQAACAEDDGVEAKVPSLEFRMFLHIETGGPRDPFPLPQADGAKSHILLLTPLYLHEGNQIATRDDQVDLAQARTPAAGENSVAFQPQPPGGEAFRPLTSAQGCAPHCRITAHPDPRPRPPESGRACTPAAWAGRFPRPPDRRHPGGCALREEPEVAHRGTLQRPPAAPPPAAARAG